MPEPRPTAARVALLLLLLLPSSGAAGPDSLLVSGPMVGYGEMTEVQLWVQTLRPADVRYRYRPEGTTETWRESTPTRSGGAYAATAHTLIAGLAPGTTYEYDLLLDGAVVRRPYARRFRTQPLWQWRTDPPAFTVATGSCFYVNDPPWDRPGKPYGGDYGILGHIAAAQPDLMIWTGDNVYYREADWTSVAAMVYRNTHTRSLPELQPLLGATHHYATWDDHDFGPNNSDRTFNLRREALEVFRTFWANRSWGTDDIPGVFGRFTWGDAEFFLLDDRYHRVPNDVPAGPEKTMFGPEQLRWLQESLVSSGAAFKVIVNGNQIIPPNRFESLSDYPADRNALLRWIREQRIPGVLFLSGDRHITELSVLPDTGFYPLYEFTSSPLTSGVGANLKEEGDSLQVPGTFVNDARTFGLLRFAGPRTARTLTIEAVDTEGRRRWSRTITAAELRPRGR